MTTKIDGNYFHLLRKNDKLNMQRYFIFVDTETNELLFENKKELTLKLGWAIFYDNETKEKIYKYFDTVKEFWEWFFSIIEGKKDIYFYAHNTDFDFKVLDGLTYLLKDYLLSSFYIQGKVFIMNFKNDKQKIHILDTYNYVPVSLKYIGKSIGLLKGEIDFVTCSKEELSSYCKNDVEIICLFIQKLIEFLEKYELSKLKSTSASLSLNIFRHKFYDKKNKPIYVHNWLDAIALERESYKGGICDCFKIGKFKNHLFKLDINSMYPYIMKKCRLPYKLLYYGDKRFQSEEFLKKKLFDSLKDDKDVIVDCIIYLPEEYAYILNKCKIDNESKAMFLSGRFNAFLTTPELLFVLKYGKLLKVNALSVYDSRVIFDDFVDFFYNKRLEFKQEGNDTYTLFCKLILNSLYGKFGQKRIDYNIITNLTTFDIKSKKIYEYNSDTQEVDTITQTQIGNKVFSIEDTENNSFDTFVAISSFITAYARMYLIELILKAKRDTVYYVDTDCLIVNKKGFVKLQPLIDNSKLGYLKLEGESRENEFISPKFYRFDGCLKCKGVKSSALLLSDTPSQSVYKQEHFEKFKTSLRKGNIQKQVLTDLIKVIDKKYNKGIIRNSNVIPYYVED